MAEAILDAMQVLDQVFALARRAFEKPRDFLARDGIDGPALGNRRGRLILETGMTISVMFTVYRQERARGRCDGGPALLRVAARALAGDAKGPRIKLLGYLSAGFPWLDRRQARQAVHGQAGRTFPSPARGVRRGRCRRSRPGRVPKRGSRPGGFALDALGRVHGVAHHVELLDLAPADEPFDDRSPMQPDAGAQAAEIQRFALLGRELGRGGQRFRAQDANTAMISSAANFDRIGRWRSNTRSADW
jgi:hypothetical protein